MKKILVLSVGAVMLISSCGSASYGDSVYLGSSLGATLGSAIGGISGGHRGHDIGTIIGMAGGAVVGSAIESNAQKQRAKEIEERNARRRVQAFEEDTDNLNTVPTDSGFDPNNSGDDIIYDDLGLPEVPASVLVAQNEERNSIEISNIQFVDSNNDNVINPNETCKLKFDIKNNSKKPLYNVMPSVTETTGNKHIYISEGVCIEQINPNNGVHYTAMIKADKKLKNGNVKLKINVTLNGTPIETGIEVLDITTRK